MIFTPCGRAMRFVDYITLALELTAYNVVGSSARQNREVESSARQNRESEASC